MMIASLIVCPFLRRRPVKPATNFLFSLFQRLISSAISSKIGFTTFQTSREVPQSAYQFSRAALQSTHRFAQLFLLCDKSCRTAKDRTLPSVKSSSNRSQFSSLLASRSMILRCILYFVLFSIQYGQERPFLQVGSNDFCFR